MFQQYTKHAETVRLASYKVAWNVALAKKPNQEGKFFKQYLTDVIETLAPVNKKLEDSVKDLQLSRHTAEHRISDINTATESELHSDLQKCTYFSVALDESHDMQLAIFA